MTLSLSREWQNEKVTPHLFFLPKRRGIWKARHLILPLTQAAHLVASDSTLGSWQPRPIKAELFTSPTHHSSVDDLVRAPKGNLCLSAFSMHCDHDLTLAPLFMLVSVKAAAVLGQPFPKCGTFHCFVPVYQDPDWIGSSSVLGCFR
ncbi:MAG: hypothetical protein WAR76_13025 [Xanthobacteraceae bacterium]